MLHDKITKIVWMTIKFFISFYNHYKEIEVVGSFLSGATFNVLSTMITVPELYYTHEIIHCSETHFPQIFPNERTVRPALNIYLHPTQREDELRARGK
jgi:hypothetical protein